MQKPKNIVVTGGNNGVGFQTVKGLYRQGHNIIFGSRNNTKNQQAVNLIVNSTNSGGSVIAFPLDLAARKSIQEFAKNVKSKFDQIDILVNNAGLIINGEKQTSELGIQMTITINHFGPFYLTYLLWDSLVKAPEARIINVSSAVHYRAPENYLEDLQCKNKSYSAWNQYYTSKIYNVLFTRGLNELVNARGYKHIKTASLHPGVVDTNFGQDGCLFKFFKCLCCCMIIDQQTGARTSLYLCKTPFTEIRNGQYYDADTTFKQMDARGRNYQDVAKLWQISQKIYGISFK